MKKHVECSICTTSVKETKFLIGKIVRSSGHPGVHLMEFCFSTFALPER